MRGKRAKQYRKLMNQYSLTFRFREPYQVLVDAHMIIDAERFKMKLLDSLERTLSGKVKAMITQCSIRHLYTLPTSETLPAKVKESLIATAKTMERRRCGHHELENPLSTLECLANVVDPKGSKTNKNCYVVASQEEEVRRYCRGIKGVPLLYVKRSVMVMEPMSEGSVGVRESTEKEKFRQGLRGRVAGLGKRKRDEEDSENGGIEKNGTSAPAVDGEAGLAKKKRVRGPSGPNPLSVKKPKKDAEAKAEKANGEDESARTLEVAETLGVETGHIIGDIAEGSRLDLHPSKRKKKRRRQKPKIDGVSGLGEDTKVGEMAQTPNEDGEEESPS